MKNNRRILLAVFLSAFILQSRAQEIKESPQEKTEEKEKKKFEPENLFFGGNFGASFSSNSFFVNLSPQAGYRFNQYLAAGAGINFIYTQLTYRYANGDKYYRASYGTTGLNIFGRVYPLRQAFLQIQPELNWTWGKYKYYNNAPDLKLPGKFAPALLAGVGIAIPAGRGAMIIMAQYDLIQHERSPYSKNVFFSFGFNF